MSAARSLALLWLPLLAVACGGSPPPAPRRAPDASAGRYQVFSAARAWADLEALAGIGPRASGTRGARAARAHIRAALAERDIEAHEFETRLELPDLGDLEFTHVVASVPGDSPELFVLVAPYDSSRFDEISFVGVNDGASGAALLLELARVLAEHPLPYTTRLVFLDGEGRLGHGGPRHEELRGLGSRSLAAYMRDAGELAAVRLLVAFNRVCDADLRIARDLGSHRMYREEFWKAAARLGRGQAFPADQGFESPPGSHVAFRDLGVRPVLAIEDTALGGDVPPGIYADTEQDDLAHCAEQSLETVGVVAIGALETIGSRLAKIDRFARMPLLQVETETRGEAGAAPAGDTPAAGDAQIPRESPAAPGSAEAAQD